MYNRKYMNEFYEEARMRDQSYANASRKTSSLNFLEFFGNEIPYDYKLKKAKPRKTPHEPLSFEMDDSHRFRNTVAITKNSGTTINSLSNSSRNTGMREYTKKKQQENEILKQFDNTFGNIKQEILVPVEVVDWESQVLQEDTAGDDVQIKEYVNNLLESGWEKYVCYDETDVTKNFMTIYIDDPNLIFEKLEEKKQKQKKKGSKASINEKIARSKFNISNDKYYTLEIKNKASLGTFGVQHSLPALKLDPKFYKTNLLKEELRNFHKPPFTLQEHQTYSFKEPSKTGQVGSIIKKSHELSLLDNSKFIIFEYYEEFPFFITNPGMASLMNVYYRRVDTTDEPTADNCIVLEPEDEAPFFGFGDVKTGTYIKTIDNNLFIAPIATHKTTDFLCIQDQQDWILRPIETLHLVGQELPKEEVFAPHSRKLNQFCKDRLKVAAYRIFSKGKDLNMTQLDQMFPYFSEGSKRKWLKEFCESEKKGKENVWVLKDSCSIVGEEDLRKLVTPENICQYESMLAVERRMQDLGYKVNEGEDEEENYDVYSPSWYLSRNFVNAAGGRGMLELSGSPDIASAGESFSFRKIRLKKGSESENRRIITEHQSTYKERVNMIWHNHIEAINHTEQIIYTPAEKKTLEEVPSETTQTESMNCLIIKRTYDDKGVKTVKLEKVHDSAVIKAYLKARKTVKIDEKKSSFSCSSCGQIGHMKTNKSCPNFVGVTKQPKKRSDEKKAGAVFQDKLNKLVSVFMNIPFSNAFHRPVPLKKFPNYLNIVKNPIDLGTVKANIKAGKYTKYVDFLNDLRLMKENCALYNGPSHSLTEIAQGILDQAVSYLNENEDEIRNLEMHMERNSQL